MFKEFGFEIKRNDGKSFTSKETTFSDKDLTPGTYSYTIRARGRAKEKGKAVYYVSDFSEPAGGTIRVSCPRPPPT